MSQEPPLYVQAARYQNPKAAGKAYTPLQQIVHEAECELSVYRFFKPREKKWYVVVIGEQPDPQLQKRIETILTTLTRGERVELSEETRLVLLARRVQQTRKGEWVEHHYRLPEQEE